LAKSEYTFYQLQWVGKADLSSDSRVFHNICFPKPSDDQFGFNLFDTIGQDDKDRERFSSSREKFDWLPSE